MTGRIIFVVIVILVFADGALVRREVAPTPMDLLDSFHQNVDQFRQCLDQSFARTVGEVNEKQLQPLFIAISDHLGRVSKAFEALTAPASTKAPPE